MPDLVEKFFQEGLNEAEEQALGEAIWASEDTAEKFAKTAKEAYFRYGFPEPPMPGSKGPSSGAKDGATPWIWGGILMIGLGAFLFARGRMGLELSALTHGTNPFNILITTPPDQIGAVNPIVIKASQERTPQPAKAAKNETALSAVPAESLGLRPVSESGNIPVAYSQPALSTQRVPSTSEIQQPKLQGLNLTNGPPSYVIQPATALKPINLDLDPQSDYSSVSAIVHLSNPTSLTVRVLDTRGLQVQLLFNGTLGPGHWVFQWDGRLADSRLASPGFYQIEIKAGLFVESKTVQIR